MRLLFLDLETTGLKPATDRIIELGLSLWDWEPKPSPLVSYGIFLNDNFTPLPEEIVRITGITDDILKEFGQSPKSNFEWMLEMVKTHKPSFLIGHNIKNFDALFLWEEFKRLGLDYSAISSLPIIDTRFDLKFPQEPASRKLKHLASDAGICPQKYAHRAVFDCFTTAELLATHSIGEVIAYSKIPWITVRAMVSYDDRELAKAERYMWEKLGDKSYPKCWVKQIKEDQFEIEVQKCKFPVVQI